MIEHTVSSTVSLPQAAQTRWDLVVLGAGPAGSMAAREAARRGLRVLLVDRNTFPRGKVCGCCVNRAAQQLLGSEGLASISVQGVNLDHYQVAHAGRVATMRLTGGMAVSREQLDACLVRAAIRSGADFVDATEGFLPTRSDKGDVALQRNAELMMVRCKAAVVATGLGARFLAQAASQTRRTAAGSRIGAGVVLDHANAAYRAGTVYMACHAWGYVGLVRLEDGQLDVAAALDTAAVKRCGGIGTTVSSILGGSGLPLLGGLEQVAWRGTAKLTQRAARLYGDRFLLAGDAAGYVEPFTGEGIAWAMATGKAVVPFAIRAAREPIADVGRQWEREYRRIVGPRMVLCRGISMLLRRPWLIDLAVGSVARQPKLLTLVQRCLNAPFPLRQNIG